MPTITCRALDVSISVRLDGDDPVLERLLEPLRSDPQPSAVEYHLVVPSAEPGMLEFAGQTIGLFDSQAALRQLLVTHIGRQVIAGLSGPWVHACLVDIDGAGVLLVGPTGAGKSTLTAHLLRRGATLVCEDICALDETASPRPYHRPIGLAPSGIRELGLDVDSDCDCGKEFVLPEQLGSSYSHGARVDLIAFIDRSTSGCREIAPALALARLIQSGIGSMDAPVDDLPTLGAMAARSRAVDLGTLNLEEATEAVEVLASSPRPENLECQREVVGDAVCVLVGSEAVVWRDGDVQHLNSTAATVWLLRSDGLNERKIAKAMRCDRSLVRAAIDSLANVGLS